MINDAIISLEELFKLVRENVNWQADGSEPTESVLDISLGGTQRVEEPVFNQDLARQTLTYEGRDVTIVLDFDEKC
jgi:hypothetical protein